MTRLPPRAALTLLLAATGTLAHEVRPAYLELRQTGAERYDVLWKVPARGDSRLGVYVRFPQACRAIGQPRGGFVNDAFVQQWTVEAPGGLAGREVRVDGLAGTRTDVLARVERLDGTTQVARLTPANAVFTIEAAASGARVAGAYLGLGIEHILLGIDHLLFVLALLILTRGGWKLVQTVTAFSVSHSLTLTAATLGFVHVPQRPVEAVIALSIVFVAAEIVRGFRGRRGLAARAPWIVAFAFGLLHGLGFAGGLSEVGLPEGHIPTALLFFSAGVETGHLLFVAAVLGLIAVGRRARVALPRWAPLAPSYAIGSVAVFWMIQRVAAF